MFPPKVTEVQERQMSTIQDENMHCISVEGDYDAAQAIVKAAFADQRFRSEVQLGSVDSNWACLLAQISYYFYSYLRVTDVTDTPESGESGEQRGEPLPISYTVPTGNVGDILAGYYAKRMGLNVARLVICTNENDALHRFLNTGRYEKKPAVPTAALSMDVAVSSDWERYLYHLAGEVNPSIFNPLFNLFNPLFNLFNPLSNLFNPLFNLFNLLFNL
ncbi:tryptophan synthase beta subunit-like PLP-dependent enzyme, partial [Ochromonadaceae sp. CCMP2298]